MTKQRKAPARPKRATFAAKNPAPDVPQEIRYGCDGRARLHYSPERKRWSKTVESEFLDNLAGSGNVSWSAKAAGIDAKTAWYHRRTKPAVAEQWALALDQAYTSLEFEFVTAARQALTGNKFPAELKIKPMSAADALRLLTIYKASLARDGRRGGSEPMPKRMEDIREDILRKIRAIQNGPGAQG